MEEGLKLDSGKPRIADMVGDFREPLLEICKVWEFGANKYEESNWKKVEDGEKRYTNAMVRHLLAEYDDPIDSESGLHHAVHVAWNAIARLWFILQEEKKYIRPMWKDMITDFYECNQGLYNT